MEVTHRITITSVLHVYKIINLRTAQGFMQDKIIASHTCFGGHMEVNC